MIKTLISVAPKVAPIVYKVFKEDANHFYGNQFIVDYGVIRTTHFKAFDYEDQFLVVERVDEERSHWWIKNFAPETKVWDGSSLALDKGKIWFLDFDALFRASMFHDVVYERAEAISKATGIPVKKLLAFADDCLKILAEGYGASPKMTTPLHKILRFGGNMFHRLKKLFVLALLLSLCGCYTVQTEMEGPPPDIQWIGPIFDILNDQSTTNNTQEIVINQNSKTNNIITTTNPVQPETSNVNAETTQSQTDLNKDIRIASFGSPNCSKATEIADCQIAKFKMNKSGMSYKWVSGGCERLGASSKEDYSQTIAIIGYSNDGITFHCGKFDWVSTSRETRDFKNIYEGYNGFDKDKFFNAKRHCFFVMSKDGKKRTNILTD